MFTNVFLSSESSFNYRDIFLLQYPISMKLFYVTADVSCSRRCLNELRRDIEASEKGNIAPWRLNFILVVLT